MNPIVIRRLVEGDEFPFGRCTLSFVCMVSLCQLAVHLDTANRDGIGQAGGHSPGPLRSSIFRSYSACAR